MNIAKRAVMKFSPFEQAEDGSIPTWARRLAASVQGRDRKAGRRGTITALQVMGLFIEQGGHCKVNGITFSTDDHNPRSLVQFPFAPSLGSIDPDGGYDPANVRLVSVVTNFAMNQWGLKTLPKLSLGVVESMKDGVKKAGQGTSLTEF